MESETTPVDALGQLDALADAERAVRQEAHPPSEQWQAFVIGLVGPMVVATVAFSSPFKQIVVAMTLLAFGLLGIREARKPRVRRTRSAYPRPLALRTAAFVFTLIVSLTLFDSFAERGWSSAQLWAMAIGSYAVFSGAIYLWIGYFNSKIASCIK